MSECRHKYLLDVQGGFYYCPNCPDEWTIQDLLKERTENQACIKALEEYNENARQHIETIESRNEALEGVVLIAMRVIDLAVSLRDENGYCPLCTEGQTGCVVLEMENHIKKLEEV